ncbi:MAG: hypothetical protein MZV63_04565 [Marinilabiliales bacterium]|nr:hypothetical protein [Marinilabiliales bacterium]
MMNEILVYAVGEQYLPDPALGLLCSIALRRRYTVTGETGTYLLGSMLFSLVVPAAEHTDRCYPASVLQTGGLVSLLLPEMVRQSFRISIAVQVLFAGILPLVYAGGLIICIAGSDDSAGIVSGDCIQTYSADSEEAIGTELISCRL